MKRFQKRFKNAYHQVRQPMLSCNTSMASGMKGKQRPVGLHNNFMLEEKHGGAPAGTNMDDSQQQMTPYF